MEQIRFVKHNDIDKKKWDDCIGHAINALPYAYSWYLDIAAEKKWDALVLGDYDAVFPLPYKNRIVFKQLYQPFFTQQLGLFYRLKKHAGKTETFLRAIPTQFKNRFLQLNTQNTIDDPSVKIKIKLTHHLDLSVGYEKIAAAYSTNLRRNLKKAVALGLVISNDTTASQVINMRSTFLAEELKGVQNEKDASRLKKLMQKALQLDQAFIVGVTDDSKNLLAAVFFLRSCNHIIYLSAVSSDKGKESHAMGFLIDHVLRTYAGSPFIFDFEGSMIPGVARFYKSFGAMEMHFPVLVK